MNDRIYKHNLFPQQKQRDTVLAAAEHFIGAAAK